MVCIVLVVVVKKTGKRKLTDTKKCKYCSCLIESPRRNQVMCKRCKRLHNIEYDRLYKLAQRDGGELIGSVWQLKPLQCPFCGKFSLGRKTCKECENMRAKICDQIINELTKVTR